MGKDTPAEVISSATAYTMMDMAMRLVVDIDRGDEVHQRAKEYADRRGLKHPRAYAELLEVGLEHAGDGA